MNLHATGRLPSGRTFVSLGPMWTDATEPPVDLVVVDGWEYRPARKAVTGYCRRCGLQIIGRSAGARYCTKRCADAQKAFNYRERLRNDPDYAVRRRAAKAASERRSRERKAQATA